MKPADDIDTLLHALRPFMSGVPTPDAGSHTEPTRNYLELQGPAEGALACRVRWDDETISVVLADWSHTWARGDDDTNAEVVDLVAAAMTGRVRACAHVDRGAVVRLDIEFATQDGWRLHETVRRGGSGLRGLFRRHAVEVWQNEGAPPAGIVLAAPGRLPAAPWVGVVATDDADAAVPIPLDGELDLHTYSPDQVGPLVKAYIEACQQQGVTSLRIVHGKGIGNLRRTVHALLERHRAVAGFRLGGAGEGSWGATVVDLRPGARAPTDE